MKTRIILATLLLSLTAGGCKQSTPPPAPVTDPQVVSQKLDDAKQNASAAAADLKDYTYAKKTEYVQKMRDELAALNQEIDEFGDKIAQESTEAKAAAQPKLDALHAQADKLKAQLDKAEDATEAGWDDFKQQAESDYNDLKKSCDDARQWVSDKIAPNPPTS